MKVKCNDCKREFKTKIFRKVKRIDGRKVEFFFFRCPACGRKYEISYQTEETKQLTKQIQDMREWLKLEQDPRRALDLFRRIEETQSMLKKKLKQNKEQYQTYFFETKKGK